MLMSIRDLYMVDQRPMKCVNLSSTEQSGAINLYYCSRLYEMHKNRFLIELYTFSPPIRVSRYKILSPRLEQSNWMVNLPWIT